jgi:arylsulfatase A-like enzyme
MDKDNPLSASDYHETPGIDTLAKRGMRFSQGYSPAALCTPTRRSILFGQTQIRQGLDEGFDKRYDPYKKGYLTIPNMLKDVNPEYKAAHFGKWHIKSGEFTPEDFGFDESDGNTDNGDGSRFEYKDEKWKHTYVVENPKRIDRMTQRGISFMRRSQNAGNPFFLQLSHYATHVDIQTKAATYEHFSGKPRGSIHDHPGYAGMLADMDTSIVQLLDAIENLGLEKNTYIILLADNGGVEFIPPSRFKLAPPGINGRKQRNAPLRGGKWVLYEGGIRVPFIVSGPGIPRNSQSDVPVVGYDILPTLAEISGYSHPIPKYVDGGSFATLLRDGTGTVERPSDAIFHHREAGSYLHSAVRVGDYKLVKFWTDNAAWDARVELYDLSKDIGEEMDLSSQLPDKAKELETILLQHVRSVKSHLE